MLEAGRGVYRRGGSRFAASQKTHGSCTAVSYQFAASQCDRAPAPPVQLCNDDGAYRAGLGQSHDIGKLDVIILSTRRLSLEHVDQLEAAALGKGEEIALLAIAGLIGGRNPAVSTLLFLSSCADGRREP